MIEINCNETNVRCEMEYFLPLHRATKMKTKSDVIPLPSFPRFVVQRVLHQKFFLDSLGCAIFHDVIVQKPSAFKALLCYQKGGSGGMEVVVQFTKSISFWLLRFVQTKSTSHGVPAMIIWSFLLSSSLLPTFSLSTSVSIHPPRVLRGFTNS